MLKSKIHDARPAGTELENEVALIDEGTCTECGLCVEECPNGAVSLPR